MFLSGNSSAKRAVSVSNERPNPHWMGARNSNANLLMLLVCSVDPPIHNGRFHLLVARVRPVYIGPNPPSLETAAVPNTPGVLQKRVQFSCTCNVNSPRVARRLGGGGGG